MLKTKQEESLRDFYGTLGIEFQTEQHGTGPTHHAGELGDLIMEIYPLNENAMTDQTTRLGFIVEDLRQTLEFLENLNLIEKKDPVQTEWGLRVVLRDPDGRAVELYQRL